MTDRSGSWSRPGSIPRFDSHRNLPREVVAAYNEMIDPDNVEIDWTMRKASDGNLWLISRLWEDEENYQIATSIIKWESDLINFPDTIPPFNHR